MRKAICPGSFDPVTNGHLDVISRAARIFDEVIVVIMSNPRKKALFTVEERLVMLREATSQIPNAVVATDSGLLIDFARSQGAQAIVKGLRPIQDFEYEWQMGMANQELDDQIETFFLLSRKEYSHLSSSIVRELAAFGSPVVDELVPPGVAWRLREKFGS